MPPKKATRGRAAANKVAKPTQSSSTHPSKAIKSDKAGNPSGPGRGRRANAIDPAVIPDPQPPPEEMPPPKKAKGTRGRPKATKEPEPKSETEPEPTLHVEDSVAEIAPEPEKHARGRKGRAAKKPDQMLEEPQETEYRDDTDGMDIDMSDDSEQIEGLPPPPQRNPLPSAPRPPQPAPFGSVSRRPASITEYGTGTADPTLRRRLGDLTQKYDALELKYRDLREIGVKEAERNFDKLKRQSEERTNTANQLIASLKAELATQSALAKEGVRTKNQLDESESKIDELQSSVGKLTAELAEARAEIKMLNTKLAASRTAEAAANPRYPGSALKNGLMAARQAANNDAAQLGQVKGELYCDLTGLIITGVKKDGEEDVFDCIQTGRNGTLHFKLFVANENSSDSFEDAEFSYKPQLDPNRDRALIEILPGYLVEEINFPRPHASKFYARVMKALTETPGV